MAILELKRYLHGPLEIKKDVGNDVLLGGYVSTPDIDYANDMCPVDSWNEDLPIYQANPIYCFQHDKFIPIGRTDKAYVDEGGLVLDDVELNMDLEFVSKVIYPLVKNKNVTQQSAGFLSLDPAPQKGGGTVHRRNLLLEGSLVSIAMNRHASTRIKTIEGWKDYEDAQSLIRDYYKGLLVFDKSFFVPGNYEVDSVPELKVTAVENSDIIEASNVMKLHILEIQKGLVADSKVARQEAIHAAYREDGGKRTYLYELGAINEDKSFEYDWNKVAVATARVLGARGGDRLEGVEKKALLERLSEAYTVLGKAFPVYTLTDQPLSELEDWKLEAVSFKEVKFANSENDVFKAHQLVIDLNNVRNALKGYTSETTPSAVSEILKDIYGSFSFSVYMSTYSEEDMEFLSGLIALINQFNHADDEDGDDFSMDMTVTNGFVKWLDGETRYGKIVGGDTGTITVTEYVPYGFNYKGITNHPYLKSIDAAERAKIPAEDFAGPDSTFPIRDQEDVIHAAELLHHAADPSAVKAKIIEIANRKGLKLPATWSHASSSEDKSLKLVPYNKLAGTTIKRTDAVGIKSINKLNLLKNMTHTVSKALDVLEADYKPIQTNKKTFSFDVEKFLAATSLGE